jgi:hypothetical protein
MGFYLQLWADSLRRGMSLTLYGPCRVSSLGPLGWNDITSSAISYPTDGEWKYAAFRAKHRSWECVACDALPAQGLFSKTLLPP